MTPASRWIYAVTFILASSGFLVPFWPLALFGVALCALSGRYFFALFLGLLLDLAWGVPTGLLHYLYFPFAILALVCALARLWANRWLFNRQPQDTI
jgi:hypothetical protein